MIELNTAKLKEIASRVAMGVDGDRTSPLSELLELELKNKNLTLRTTNKEYFLETVIENVTESDEYFHATISADVFLTLIVKTTTEKIKIKRTDNSIEVQSSGKYMFPLIMEGEDIVRLPEIPFNVTEDTVDMTISGNILKSLYDFNAKEMTKEIASDQLLRNFYFDQEGALTYIESACINEFKLEKPIKVLFNERLVQLFKLFAGADVNVKWNKMEAERDSSNNIIYRNLMSFEVPNLKLTSRLAYSDMVDRYPSESIRDLGNVEYPSVVQLSKPELLGALDRLSIFDKKGNTSIDLKKCGKLEFKTDHLKITNVKDGNFEILNYLDNVVDALEFVSYVSLSDLSKHTNISLSDSVSMFYGTGDALMIKRQSYKQVIPEMADPTQFLGN